RVPSGRDPPAHDALRDALAEPPVHRRHARQKALRLGRRSEGPVLGPRGDTQGRAAHYPRGPSPRERLTRLRVRRSRGCPAQRLKLFDTVTALPENGGTVA